MQPTPPKATAPCIINEGTLVNKRDMIRAVETLECVTYYDILDGGVISQGDGVLVKIFASKDSATLIVNGSIFLNVLSFDHLHFSSRPDGETVIELINGARILRLIPREEDPKLMARVNQNAFAYETESMDSDGACAQHLLDDIGELDEDDR